MFRDYCMWLFMFFAVGSSSGHLCAQTSTRKIDSLKQAVLLSKTDTEKVKLLNALTYTIHCSDTTAALKYLSEAMSIAKKINWTRGIIMTNRELGRIYGFCIEDINTSLKYYLENLSISQKSGDNINEARALTDIAGLYRNFSKNTEALNYYRKALVIKTDPDTKLGILGNMGIHYSEIGDYKSALACYDSSLIILDEVIRTSKKSDLNDSLMKGGLFITIGDIYLKMSLHSNAIESYNKSLKLSEQTGSKYLKVYSLIGIGKTYQHQKEYVNAIDFYEKALQDCKEDNHEDACFETMTYNLLANLYIETNEIEKAAANAQKALKIAEKQNYYFEIAVTYTALGKVYTAQKNYKQSIFYLKDALAISTKNCELNNEKDAWEALSNTYQQMNNPALAFEAYKHFISIRDSLYNLDKFNEINRIDYATDYYLRHVVDSLRQQGDYKLRMQKQQAYTFSGFAGLAVVLLLSFFIYRSYSQEKKANIKISKANNAIKEEKQVSENLLLNILPEDVAKELKTNGSVHARLFDNVTVVFTDFVNFTEAGERLTPEELVAELHTCFMAFDGIISKYNIEKIKTVGDAYLAVSGLPLPNPNHARDTVLAALEFQDFMIARQKELGDRTFAMRVGVHTGTVVAGIVGVKKFAYDIWGDTVNTAARMQQYSDPDKVNISQTTYELIKNDFNCIDRGEIAAKHKGNMRMYFAERLNTTKVV